jgi:hypothetical protein
VFNPEVAVDTEGLRPGENRVIAIDVLPTRLYHANGRILEKRQRALKKIGLGYKICIENRNELALGDFQALSQGTGFISLPMAAVEQSDIEALPAIPFDEP